MNRIGLWAGIVLILMGARSEAVETIIKGARMELRNKGETVVFTDGVRLERGSDTLKAVEMTTTKKRDKVTATGNVDLFRRLSATETWQGFGDSAFYNSELGTGYLLGNKKKAHLIRVEVLSSTSMRQIDIFADRFDFWKEDSTAVAKGQVYGKTVDPDTQELYEFWSDEAWYYGKERKIFLTGTKQPRMRQSGQEGQKNLRGNSLTYLMDKNELISEGEAEAVFIDQKKEKDGKKKK